MSICDRIVAFIKRTEHSYEYNINDFQVYDINGNVTIVWSPQFSIQQPDSEQINSVTQEELDCLMCCKRTKCNIDVVSNISNILSPIDGSTIIYNDSLKIYINGNWTSQKEITDINTLIASLILRIEALENAQQVP